MEMVQCQEVSIRNCGTSADRGHCGVTPHHCLWWVAEQFESNNLKRDPYGERRLICHCGASMVIILCT